MKGLPMTIDENVVTKSLVLECGEGLRLLANWFDKRYNDAGKEDRVQIDLRRWADDHERLVAKFERLEREHLFLQDVIDIREGDKAR